MSHNIVRDDGALFQIVPSMRKIVAQATHTVLGTVGDHLSEQVTFQIPLTVDGHDIKNCARRYVTWKNALGGVGTDNLVFLDEDNEFLYFTWTIRDGLTLAAGSVQFAVRFEDVDGETFFYRWGTAPCTECTILDTIGVEPGTYKAMWVDGETLVIADYTPVENRTLSLTQAASTTEV